MELLKNKAKRLVPHISQGIVIQKLHSGAIQPIAPGTGTVEATKDVHGSAFAGTTGPHDRQIVTTLNGQVQTIESPDFKITTAVDLVDVAQFSDDIRPCCGVISQGQLGRIAQWLLAEAGFQ